MSSTGPLTHSLNILSELIAFPSSSSVAIGYPNLIIRVYPEGNLFGVLSFKWLVLGFRFLMSPLFCGKILKFYLLSIFFYVTSFCCFRFNIFSFICFS